ncbi:MAG TPA: ATP-dependent helicase [Candidatus Angelobacter sp.]|jgi:superfamily I DNA/RNA helicase|nr:ATP-dependent helicase [Candidatus Angelobacter sp.]
MSERSDDDLDEEQTRAAEAPEAAIIVLAGPGSGKTRTLARRARHLLTIHPDDHALLLTFTNKAAAEMKGRALAVSSVSSSRILACTFHAFGYRLLQRHGDLVGIKSGFDVLDEEEQGEFARQVADDHGIPNFARSWEESRVQVYEPGWDVASFGRHYEARKRAAGVVDFTDLIHYSDQVLAAHPAAAAAYGGKYRHILVDEFQDTNALQYALLSRLASPGDTVSAFADDDQAIFRFAGADVENVRSFISDYSAMEYPLIVNHRCREAIVEVANRLILSDPSPSGRTMQAKHPGGSVTYCEYPTGVDEAEAVLEDIRARARAGAPLGGIGILARKGYRANEVVDALRGAGLPFTDWRGDIFDPEERRALAACLSVVRGELTDRQAHRLSRLLDSPVVPERRSHQFLEGHGANPLAVGLLDVRTAAFQGAPVIRIVELIVEAVARVDKQLSGRMSALAEAVAGFAVYDPDFTLEQLLAEFALGAGGRSPNEGGGIKVATIHRTKGLEWNCVYLIGMEEGQLPDYRAHSALELSDERRLCFVGVCRALFDLRISSTSSGGGYLRRPSLFLREMGLVS